MSPLDTGSSHLLPLHSEMLGFPAYTYDAVVKAIQENTLGELSWNRHPDGREHSNIGRIYVRMPDPAYDVVIQTNKDDGTGQFRIFPAWHWNGEHHAKASKFLLPIMDKVDKERFEQHVGFVEEKAVFKIAHDTLPFDPYLTLNDDNTGLGRAMNPPPVDESARARKYQHLAERAILASQRHIKATESLAEALDMALELLPDASPQVVSAGIDLRTQLLKGCEVSRKCASKLEGAKQKLDAANPPPDPSREVDFNPLQKRLKASSDVFEKTLGELNEQQRRATNDEEECLERLKKALGLTYDRESEKLDLIIRSYALGEDKKLDAPTRLGKTLEAIVKEDKFAAPERGYGVFSALVPKKKDGDREPTETQRQR